MPLRGSASRGVKENLLVERGAGKDDGKALEFLRQRVLATSTYIAECRG